jgi:hypothetical protein
MVTQDNGSPFVIIMFVSLECYLSPIDAIIMYLNSDSHWLYLTLKPKERPP